MHQFISFYYEGIKKQNGPAGKFQTLGIFKETPKITYNNVKTSLGHGYVDLWPQFSVQFC